jgi:hypothetical protein
VAIRLDDRTPSGDDERHHRLDDGRCGADLRGDRIDDDVATPLGILASDLVGEDRQTRRLEEAEADPVFGQLGEPPAVVEPPTRDRAHLVVELRPAGTPAAVAEADERDGLGWRRDLSRPVGFHRWGASFLALGLYRRARATTGRAVGAGPQAPSAGLAGAPRRVGPSS